MKVLVIGATGYIGAATARALRTKGHAVTGLARSDAAHEHLVRDGYGVVIGDVADPKTLIEPARASDAVIYAVQLQQPDAADVESLALRALVDALNGSSKSLLYTSGVWYYGPTGDRIADEESPPNPPPAISSRPILEGIVLDSCNCGVRAHVTRAAPVYGEGRGLPALYTASAREHGAARTIGDGSNHWTSVHVDDLAELYTLILASGAPGDVYNATDETAFTQLEIAQAASRGAGRDGATAEWPVAEASATLGAWVEALAMDQRVTSARARSRLGWSPRTSTILDDLEHGSYVTPVAT